MSSLSGDAFLAADVAENYIHRPPYASEIYRVLEDFAPARDRLLDLGCGEGRIARRLSEVFRNVTAVDPSRHMIGLGRCLKRGRAPKVEWICATAEAAPLEGQFDMVTFASSIHWMEPETLFRRLKAHLKPKHLLAVIAGDAAFEPPWEAEWQAFLSKWLPKTIGLPLNSSSWRSTQDRHLAYLDVVDEQAFVTDPYRQSVDDYILCQHSRNSFALSRLGASVSEFRMELRDLLAPYADADGHLSFRTKTHLTMAKLAAGG